MIRTYGNIEIKPWGGSQKMIVIPSVEPHVAIKLKALFEGIHKTSTKDFTFGLTPENATNMLWFMDRYPLAISKKDLSSLKRLRTKFNKQINEMEAILSPDYTPNTILLKDGYKGRDYQLKGAEMFNKTKRLLLGDELGLGKTITSILSFFHPGTLPAIVVVQTHLPPHWMEKIEQFTNLTIHRIKGTQSYNLPPADVYIINYTCLSGWVDLFAKQIFKTVVFDEVQELRRWDSNKYRAAKVLSENVNYAMGLSATPIYNYGEEIFNIMEVLKPGALGKRDDFMREWLGYDGKRVKDPKALGAYLREQFLMLRRTRQEVGRELPPINRIVHTVDYDQEKVEESKELARTLALKIVSGSFIERGAAARELDLLARQNTGIAKARSVAQYVKYLLEAGEPVVLAGWHRNVYEIWQKELAAYNPVLFTGSETATQKEKAKQDFIEGRTKLFILSLRSGIGLDGLQYICKTVVFGELDWSPQIHNQVIGRVDRDGQAEQVTAIFLVSNEGSDPPIVNLLGLKSSQAHAIIDPFNAPKEKFSDDSRIKLLAKQYLEKEDIELKLEL